MEEIYQVRGLNFIKNFVGKKLSKYQFMNYDKLLKQQEEKLKEDKCLHCGTNGAKWRESMTTYPWNGEGENPNKPVLLCKVCYEEYRDYWEDMWNSYYSSIR